jgi:S-adenosyl methyltransferase
MGDDGNDARLNRAALGRAVRYMIAHGVTQFLDLGSGLPTVQNTHQIAQAVNPAARVVYADNDPSVRLHGQALLAGDGSTTVVRADVRAPDELLAMEEVQGFLDFGQPVGLILNAVIHHVLDEEAVRDRGPLQAGAVFRQLPVADALLRRVARGSRQRRGPKAEPWPRPGAQPRGDHQVLRRPRPGPAGPRVPALVAARYHAERVRARQHAHALRGRGQALAGPRALGGSLNVIRCWRAGRCRRPGGGRARGPCVRAWRSAHLGRLPPDRSPLPRP